MSEKIVNLLICTNCGGDLVFDNESNVAKCKYCGKTFSVGSTLNDNQLIDYKQACEYWKTFAFAEAKRKFLEVAKNNEKFADAWWGVFISEYGIEFVNKFGESVPTCHRAHTVSVFEDENLKNALKYALPKDKDEYVALADKIEEIRKKIIEKSLDGDAYDVFICFKATEIDDERKKTLDFDLGKEIYKELTDEGYKVFFSPETLLRIKEQEFEPYVYRALSTAKVLLLLCSDNKKINSPWVKNEWGRFLDLRGGEGLIPVCGNKYENYSPNSLPLELRKLNAIEYDARLFERLKSKISSFFPERLEKLAQEKREEEEKRLKRELDDLRRSIVVNGDGTTTVDSLLRRAEIFLNQGNFVKANEFYEKVLDADPEEARAYFGKALLENRIKGESKLSEFDGDISEDENFATALSLADGEFKEKLQRIKEDGDGKGEPHKKEKIEIPQKSSENPIDAVIHGDAVVRKKYAKGNIGDVSYFAPCGAKEIVLPETVKIIGKEAFKRNKNLYKITLPKGLEVIDDEAFCECENLKEIVIPDGVTCLGEASFANCGRLEKVVLPKTLTVIPRDCFIGCTRLLNAEIPQSVEVIEYGAFGGCENLKKVYIPESVKKIESIAFKRNVNVCEIYCGAKEKPDEWSDTWVDSRAKIVWNYKGIEDVEPSKKCEGINETGDKTSFANESDDNKIAGETETKNQESEIEVKENNQGKKKKGFFSFFGKLFGKK